MFTRIRYKMLLVVGISVSVGLVLTAWLYMTVQERSLLRQHEAAMHKVASSVTEGLKSVMLAGYADIAQAFADRLKNVQEVDDFRILRTNGLEAFRDNKTIDEVNRRRGEEEFLPRETEQEVRIVEPDNPWFQRALKEGEPVAYYAQDDQGRRVYQFFAPIENQKACYKCHGKSGRIRGVLKLTTSLTGIERDILEARNTGILVFGGALLLTLTVTGFALGRSVLRPIETMTRAITRVSHGQLDQTVPVRGRDELARMASSFNTMAGELQKTYEGLRLEQDKLTTIIRSAREAIVVTDREGDIVLVNPAATDFLRKDEDTIVREGFLQLVDDPARMEEWLDSSQAEPFVHEYKGRVLQVYASRILNEKGQYIGSAALMRDITEEKRLENELRKLSTLDELTQLFNRRFLDRTLEKEFARYKRYGNPLSVFMLDVDHFKRFNDTYGHDKGDRVLAAVARTLKGALRNTDYACRYGGEEFCAILPNTDREGALAVAERVRADVEAMEVDGLKITVSVGVATAPHFGGDSATKLIQAADGALYGAKKGGRNRVEEA